MRMSRVTTDKTTIRDTTETRRSKCFCECEKTGDITAHVNISMQCVAGRKMVDYENPGGRYAKRKKHHCIEDCKITYLHITFLDGYYSASRTISFSAHLVSLSNIYSRIMYLDEGHWSGLFLVTPRYA